MNLKVCLVLCSYLLVASCATPTRDDVIEKWEGRDISEAFAVMGPPQEKMTLSSEITVYIWEQKYGSANAISRATCRKGLHVNSKGKIVDASQHSGSLLCR